MALLILIIEFELNTAIIICFKEMKMRKLKKYYYDRKALMICKLDVKNEL